MKKIYPNYSERTRDARQAARNFVTGNSDADIENQLAIAARQFLSEQHCEPATDRMMWQRPSAHYYGGGHRFTGDELIDVRPVRLLGHYHRAASSSIIRRTGDFLLDEAQRMMLRRAQIGKESRRLMAATYSIINRGNESKVPQFLALSFAAREDNPLAVLLQARLVLEKSAKKGGVHANRLQALAVSLVRQLADRPDAYLRQPADEKFGRGDVEAFFLHCADGLRQPARWGQNDGIPFARALLTLADQGARPDPKVVQSRLNSVYLVADRLQYGLNRDTAIRLINTVDRWAEEPRPETRRSAPGKPRP